MDSNGKKTRERQIFDMVYGGQSFESIVDSECPDFLVRHSHENTCFGVEVTELYQSETNARLKHIDGYVGDLLNGNNVRHKDDQENLNVVTVDIVTRDNEVKYKNVPAIIQQNPNLAECSRMIANIITEKERRIESQVSCSLHVNLIIYDATSLLHHIKKQDFYATYFLPELRDSLSKSSFREIFFLTTLDKKSGFIPLKMLQILSEIYLFNGIIHERYAHSIHPDIDDVELFASYFCDTVKGNVSVLSSSDGTEAIYGNTGVLVHSDNSITVRLYGDYPIPKTSHEPTLKWRDILGNDFIGAMDEFRNNSTFHSEIFFPV